MYEDYDDTGSGGANFKDLRKELEVIDRAIGLLKETKSVNALLTSTTTTRARGGRAVSGMAASMAKARGGLGKTLQSLPQQGTGTGAGAVGKDESYLIDTTSAQIGTCPHCFEEMPLTQLRKHLYAGSSSGAGASACPNMEMRCPEEGCHAVFPARALKRHLARECAVAKRRRALVEAGLKRKELEREKERQAAIAAVAAAVAAAAQGPPPSPPRSPGADAWWGRGSVDAEGALQPEAVCELCGESMRQGVLAAHRRDACLHRPVYCPNRPLGCREEVPFARLQEHLYDRCEVERRKDALVERSTRRDVFVCPGCGEELPVSKYRRHQRELCANRKAPCKNHYLGCRVMVRPSTRAQHEDVEADAHARSCLYLGGQGTHLLLQEDDVPSPWTVEFWVMRPDAESSAKAYLRAAVAQAAAFLNAFAVERAVNIAVMKIVIGLKPKTAPKPRRKTPEQEQALREKEERKRAKESRKQARQEKRDKKEAKKKKKQKKGGDGATTDGTETDAALTDASEADSDFEMTGPMAAAAAEAEAEPEEEPEPDEPVVKPMVDEGRVLAVLTLLVEVYEAAALASLAAAQELVGTLKSALNTIDEAITGALADPVAPSFGADGELQAQAQAQAPPDPKQRNAQWMAKPAASPYAAELGVGPVAPNAVTSLVGVPPGERQRAFAAKATRDRRQREREERRQRLREREAVARRASVRAGSPSKSPERPGSSKVDARRERAVAALDSDIDPASGKGGGGKKRQQGDGGSEADIETDAAAGPRAAAPRALVVAAPTSRPVTAAGPAPPRVNRKRDLLRTPLALSVTAALCAPKERQHVFLMPPQTAPIIPAKPDKKGKAKKDQQKSVEVAAASDAEAEEDDGAGGRLLKPSEEATARRFLSSLGLLDRYTGDIEKRLGLEPPAVPTAPDAANANADDASVGSVGSAVSTASRPGRSSRRRKRADGDPADGHGTASDADDDDDGGASVSTAGGRRRKRARGAPEAAAAATGIHIELTWTQWREVALGLLKAVDQDCALLQRWRADAGLLDDKDMKRAETAASQGTQGSRPQTKEEMQTAKKKEKEKMRREARKLKRAEEQATRKAEKDAARQAKKAARRAVRDAETAGSDAALTDVTDGEGGDDNAGSDDDDDEQQAAAPGEGGEEGASVEADGEGPLAASVAGADARAVSSAGGRGRGRGRGGGPGNAGRGGRGSRGVTPASASAPSSAPTPAPPALPALRAPAPKPVKFSRRVGDLLQTGVGSDVLAYSTGADGGDGASAGLWARNLLCLDMQGSAKDRQIDVEALERAGGRKAAKKAAKAAAKAAEEKEAAAAAAGDITQASADADAAAAAAEAAAKKDKEDKEEKKRRKRMALPSVAQEFARVRVPQKPCIGLVVGSGGSAGRSSGSRPTTADTATTAGTADTAASGTSRASARGASAGVRSFEYAGASHIPRMKWTHVALVAAKTPKNRVTLYVNGQSVGQAKNYAFPLPMSAIGAPLARSFHGVLLDVRYWAKQRSAVEIQQGMHRLVAMQTDEQGRAVEAQPRVMKRVRPAIDMGRFVSNKEKRRMKRRRDRAARRSARGLDLDAGDDADDEDERIGGGGGGGGGLGASGGDYSVMTANTVPGALPGTSEGPRPARDIATRGSTRGGVRFGDEIAGSPGLVIPGADGGTGPDGRLSPPPSALKGGSRGQKRPLSRMSTTSSLSGGESSDADSKRNASRTGTAASRRRAAARGKGGGAGTSRPQTADSLVSAVSDASVAAPAPGGKDSAGAGNGGGARAGADVAAEVDLSSAGLMGWWAFEDGSSRVAQKGYVPPPTKRQRGEIEAKRDRVASARATAAAARARVAAAMQARATKAAAEVKGSKKLGFVERSRALHKQVKGGTRAVAAAVAADAPTVAVTSRPGSAAAPGAAPGTAAAAAAAGEGEGEGEGDAAQWALLEEQAEAARQAEAAAEDLRRNRVADVSERRFASLVQQRVEGGEQHRPPDPLQLKALQEGFWPPEAADTHDVGLGFGQDAPKDKKAAKKGGDKARGPLTTAGKKAASDSEGETKAQARAAKGTVVGPDALQAWRRSGGDGSRWRWLDANYLSALAPVLAAAADGQRDLSLLMADFGATGMLPDVPVPVPSYRNSQQCPYELRKNRLVQLGRALQLEVECPQGCGELVRRVDMRRHTRDECVRRQVPCRFAEVGCKVLHAWQDRSVHEAQYCKFVQARNELVRGAINNSDVVECPLCSERMPRAKVKKHTRRACAHRLVRCPYDDCGLSVQHHNLARHFKHDCESAVVLRRIYMIEAARKRTHYARPWGLEIDMAGEGAGDSRGRRRSRRRRRGGDDDDDDEEEDEEANEEDRHPAPVEIGSSGSDGEGAGDDDDAEEEDEGEA